MRSSDDERALDELIDAQHATAGLDANADLVVTMARDHLDCDFAGVTFCRRKGELETHAAIGLSHARRIAQLRVAVDGRTLIGQAQGILMERFSVGADQAFAILRRYSQDRNVKLRAIAEELVENDELTSPRPIRHRTARAPAD